MKYFVIARIYDIEKKMEIKKIVGTFESFINAYLFCEVYNSNYNTYAKIFSEADLINE